MNKNRNLYLSIDDTLHAKKPESDVGRIQNSTKLTNISLDDLSILLQQGATIRPCAIDGNSDKDFLSGQIIALDYDHPNYSMEKEINRLNDLGIPPALGYETFSSSEDNPRYRLIFVLESPINDIILWKKAQSALLRLCLENNPDTACSNPSRLFFGTSVDKPFYKDLDAVVNLDYLLSLAQSNHTNDINTAKTNTNDNDTAETNATGTVTEGHRTNTLISYIGTMANMGISEADIKAAVISLNNTFNPPLSDTELEQTVFPAIHRFSDSNKNCTNENNNEQKLMPEDFSDTGQALIFYNYGQNNKKIIYTKSFGFLVFDGKKWIVDAVEQLKMQYQSFTYTQLKYANEQSYKAYLKMKYAEEIEDEETINTEKRAFKKWEKLSKTITSYRNNSKTKGVIESLKPLCISDINLLDNNPFLLNTPDGTVNLKTGELLKHNPSDYCTKITKVSPSEKGMDIWIDQINRVCCDDGELAHYLQLIIGMAIIGNVYEEKLIIVYGNGGNGKSTFFNAISLVLGDYSGGISPNVLMYTRKNTVYEYAELRGKRFVLGKELDEGQKLNVAAVKHLCSTDKIHGEKKFQDPFEFVPTHTLLMYTNYLPSVGSIDDGTWDRLAIIPFKAKFRNTENEVKNYAKVLYEKCGGAILKWAIDGAVEFIANNYKLPQPSVLQEALSEYRDDNNWIKHFLEDRTIEKEGSSVYSKDLYNSYEKWVSTADDYKRNTRDFRQAIESYGYEYKRDSKGIKIMGIELLSIHPHNLDYLDMEAEPF